MHANSGAAPYHRGASLEAAELRNSQTCSPLRLVLHISAPEGMNTLRRGMHHVLCPCHILRPQQSHVMFTKPS